MRRRIETPAVYLTAIVFSLAFYVGLAYLLGYLVGTLV